MILVFAAFAMSFIITLMILVFFRDTNYQIEEKEKIIERSGRSRSKNHKIK